MDIVFDQHGKLQDPRDTAIQRQLKAMHQLLQAWPPAQRGELVSAWRLTWRRLQAAAHPWMVVAGPMAALQAYLMEMVWDAGALDDWVPAVQLNIEFPWSYLQKQLHAELALKRARRIQELEHCFPMMRKPDSTTYLDSRFPEDAYQRGPGRVPSAMKHLIWECCYHEQPLPAEWQRMIAANEESMLWARGMIDGPAFRPVVGVESCEVTGAMASGQPTRFGLSQRIAIGVKATCQDARVQNYVVAVTVGQWPDGTWQLSGT